MTKKEKNEPLDYYGIDYQIFILRQMVEQLPDDIKLLIHKQIDQVISAFCDKQQSIFNDIIPKLHDIMLDVNYLEFDRHATAVERDQAIHKYKQKFKE